MNDTIVNSVEIEIIKCQYRFHTNKPGKIGNIEICFFSIFARRSSVRYLNTLVLNLKSVERLDGSNGIVLFLVIDETETVTVTRL